MPRDIRGTKLEVELFQQLGDLSNPTAHLFADLFAAHKGSKPKYSVDDLITIGPDKSRFVKTDSVTSIGIYIVNKFLLEPLEIFGYVNKTFTTKVWGKIEEKLAEALMAKDISQAAVCGYIDRSQFLLGGPLAQIINPSLSGAVMGLPPNAQKLKDKLMQDNADAIASADPEAAAKIETQIVDQALADMEATEDPSLALFTSGAIDPYNNYKTMFVMKGAIADNTGESPTGYKIVTSNYNDGISKEEMPVIADSLVRSAYLKGVATQDSGTLGKKYNAVLQRIQLLEHGSDCGSTQTLDVVIDDRHLYRYIIDHGKLVLITPENLSKYKGQVHKLRTPLHCKAKDPCYCNICVGERLYRIGIHNIGLTYGVMSGSTLNASMKSFHDVRVKLYGISMDDVMKYVN